MELKRLFPGLDGSAYDVTSPSTALYNCIAWAAQRDDQWWWPDAMGQYYWPVKASREETLQAFEKAYGTTAIHCGSGNSFAQMAELRAAELPADSVDKEVSNG